MLRCLVPVVWNTHRMTLSGNSHPVLPEMSPIMLEDSEEINSLSLTWREYIIFTMRVQVLARQKQEKEQKADFYRVLQFSYLPKAL